VVRSWRRSRRAKVLAVRILQRYTLNPLFRLLLTIGVNPFALAILETRGRLSGKTRRVPVGNGRKGDSFWIIAEHGSRAGWVRNIQHDPRVRVRLRIGLRYRWVPGIATIRPDEDALARQRKVIAWHPAARAERGQRPCPRRRPARRARQAAAGRRTGGRDRPARRDDGRAAGNAGPGIHAELAGQPHADSFPRPRRSALSKASRT
jgi:deazaflavin-dependent oxidoreductase (nitroreductase family)